MFAKKSPVMAPVNDPYYRAQLEYLYARRSAIDALIESLIEYERYRARRLGERKQKTA